MRTIVATAVFLAMTALGMQQALAESCLKEAGQKEAQTYVDQCLEVSPATHPPCNAENDCQMIIDEIVRGCDMLGSDAPGFCADYAD